MTDFSYYLCDGCLQIFNDDELARDEDGIFLFCSQCWPKHNFSVKIIPHKFPKINRGKNS